jgi:hypothetical protein
MHASLYSRRRHVSGKQALLVWSINYSELFENPVHSQESDLSTGFLKSVQLKLLKLFTEYGLICLVSIKVAMELVSNFVVYIFRAPHSSSIRATL